MHEKPGFTLCPFVENFIETAAEPVPRVSPRLSFKDHLGTIGARSGFGRNDYKVTPGLYCIGEPDKDSPVLVTCNYKLSFDTLRSSLENCNCWLLVVDTRGINVWCAAGKGTFSAEEIAYQVNKAELSKIVAHRKLILPQLAANGVAAHKLKKRCCFKGEFGPVDAAMLREYLSHRTADERMRTVTFTLRERAVLIPLEVLMLWKPLLFLVAGFFVLSGISPPFFSFHAALTRGPDLLLATLVGIFSGAVLTPLLLPWVPGRQFWLKGLLTGILFAILYIYSSTNMSMISAIALFLWICAVSSYMAMNFTGCTPFTSLSGVAKEMHRGLAFQVSAATATIFCWLISPFV